ncbi:MAG: hypothetical protein R3C49_02405 [Planctomycetaceae bacterium]
MARSIGLDTRKAWNFAGRSVNVVAAASAGRTQPANSASAAHRKKRLQQISTRMLDLRQINNLKNLSSADDERKHMQKELHDLIDLTMETPDSLAAKMDALERRYEEYEKAMRDLSGGNLRLVVSIAKKYRNRRPHLHGSHSGRQHRTDASRR